MYIIIIYTCTSFISSPGILPCGWTLSCKTTPVQDVNNVSFIQFIQPPSSSPSSSSCHFSPSSSFNRISSLPLINYNPIYTLVPKQYCIAGNFRGRKLSWISRFCGYLQKFLGRNIFWWHKRQICKSFLHEIFFHQFTNVFCFLLYGITYHR